MKIIKRNGSEAVFDLSKIETAITKANETVEEKARLTPLQITRITDSVRIVCEELGLVGACIILLLFAALIIRGYWIALHARDRFGSLLVVGCISLIAMQVFLNVGVVTGLLPATGISLPFFSYGGTALLIQMAEMGVILSVSRQMKPPKNG